jgi:hypothetical protein
MKTNLTTNQINLLAQILIQHCEDCDPSALTAHKINQIWNKLCKMHNIDNKLA